MTAKVDPGLHSAATYRSIQSSRPYAPRTCSIDITVRIILFKLTNYIQGIQGSYHNIGPDINHAPLCLLLVVLEQ